MPAEAPTTEAPIPELTSAPPGPAPEPASETFPRIGPRPLPERVKAGLRKYAKPSPLPDAKEPVLDDPKPAPKKAEQKPAKPPEPELGEEPEPQAPENEENTEPAESAETEPQSGQEKPAEATPTDKGKKLSPWRLVDQWKGKAADLEKQLAEARKSAIPEAQAKELNERLQQAESKVKQYEDEIRFVSYQKSPEFLEKYDKPYQKAFGEALAELQEVQITDEAGNARAATAQDISNLVWLPLGEAKKLSDQMFGDFSQIAMNHRRDIVKAFKARQEAIEEAKTKGAEWEKQRTAELEKHQSEIGKVLSESWTKANQDVVTDTKYGQYFTPREGNQEWNQRLAKGFELVDKAFNDPSPRDPRLSGEDREKIVKRHAAVRHRAAAFGPLRWENESLKAKVSELEKALEDYRASEPGQGGGKTAKPTPAPADRWDHVRQTIRKYAR